MKKNLAVMMALGLVLFMSACEGKKNNNKAGGTSDTTQPVTTITSGPWNPSSSTEATFTFTCSKAPCTFACQLDYGDYLPCVPPKIYSGLSVGEHIVRVRAMDSLGNFDHSPPTYTWLVGDLWLAISTTGAPSARSGASSVWTGSEMIVWGGVNIVNGFEYYFLDGGKYNPVTDAWTPTNTSGAPFNRAFHTVVWTGTSMIVWGGIYNSGSSDINAYLKTGGRYIPASDSWMATSTVKAPAGRFNHSAVWTGTAMIVWGGCYDDIAGDYCLNTGGSYNPSMDIWETWANSAIGTPAARGGHSAVWTGSAMIIWGGFNDAVGAEYNTGAIYHPGTLTWTTISSTGAPSARDKHTAIWTGSEMIVWGGYSHSGDRFFNDGGRYNPAANTWSPVSTANAPSPRWMHSAVLARSQMVVWGGSLFDFAASTSTFYNTGGKYNVAADRWEATNTDGAPSGRELHNAVWTGIYMLIWGGDSFDGDNGDFYNTGGKYGP